MFNIIQILNIKQLLTHINTMPKTVHGMQGDTNLELLINTEQAMLSIVVGFITNMCGVPKGNANHPLSIPPEWLYIELTSALCRVFNNIRGNNVQYVRVFIINTSLHIILTVGNELPDDS